MMSDAIEQRLGSQQPETVEAWLGDRGSHFDADVADVGTGAPEGIRTPGLCLRRADVKHAA